MIAELGITIFLLCNSPVMVEAEKYGEVHQYTIYKSEIVNGRLEYEVGEDSNREFLGIVQAKMAAQGIKPDFKYRNYACGSA